MIFEWAFGLVSSGMSATVRSGPLDVFRYVFGIALIFKFSAELWRGGWSRLRPGSVAYQMTKPGRRAWIRALYRPCLIARLIGALLILGPAPQLGAIICAACLMFEQLYDRRSHSVYQLLMASVLACMPMLSSNPAEAWKSRDEIDDHGSWAAFMGIFFLVHLYIVSAFRKIQSRYFRSGGRLSDLFAHLEFARHSMVRFEYYIPARIFHFLGAVGSARREVIFRAAAWLTIACELAVPLLLLSGQVELMLCGVAIGFAMHVAFNVILPIQLASFALSCWASYALFFAPV